MDRNDDYYGAGIMSTFIGNHDIPRLIHLAEDAPVWDSEWSDGKDLAWSSIRPARQPARRSSAWPWPSR